jgi:hypothetical protein
MARYGWREALVMAGWFTLGIAVTAPLEAETPVVSDQWLASEQSVMAGHAPGCSGPGLTMKQLVRMSPCALEHLYAQGILAPIPSGKIRGQALLNPGTKLAVPTSRASRLVWQGKIFHCDGRTAINRFFGVRAIKAEVYTAESWRDGRPSLILDYSQTSLLYAPYRDEIRQIAPGLFLGLMFDRTACPPKLKMYFALECVPQG